MTRALGKTHYLIIGPTAKEMYHTGIALRKHAYSNILKILPPKTENSQIKKLIILHISAQKHRL